MMKLGPNQKKWIAALRGGTYRQGKRKLKTSDGAYCCMGVAHVIADKVIYLGSSVPNISVWSDYLGLRSRWGSHRSKDVQLTVLNDEGYSFNEIADELEKWPEEYFMEEK